MIQWSFLLEATFVALLGILLGVSLGLKLAYTFYSAEIASSGPESGMMFSFSIPGRIWLSSSQLRTAHRS